MRVKYRSLELVINEVEAPLKCVSLFTRLKCFKLSNHRLVLSPLGEKSDASSRDKEEDDEDKNEDEESPSSF